MSQTPAEPEASANPVPGDEQIRREALDRAIYGGLSERLDNEGRLARAEKFFKFLKKSKDNSEYAARCDALQRAVNSANTFASAADDEIIKTAESFTIFLTGGTKK